MNEFITYEQFGAIGDGVTDDMPAIARAHDEANRLGLPVKAKAGAVYYISPKELPATVQTSVDWTGAKFIFDDRDCENFRAPIFRVLPSENPVSFTGFTLMRLTCKGASVPTKADLRSSASSTASDSLSFFP